MVGMGPIRKICDEVLKMESSCGTNPFNFPWKIRIVNSFFFQQNNVDGGIFACYYFDCLSRGIKLNVGHNDGSMEIDNYRKWVAFSCCIRRMHCLGKGQNEMHHGYEKDGVIHID
mmetsp:Transcript_9185/g.20750  ORF Transcript_9185/g.20750 Transcript_9185/m.20750 type:complete len:115 (+) Transcript_9185:3-347(+)